MLGLTVLIVGAVYLALLFLATRAAFVWAKRCGWSKGMSWGAAVGGFLAVFLPLFWDWIPTLAANKYYCTTEAGFRVYKTIEQWKTENPGVVDTLSWKDVSDSSTLSDGTRRSVLNERFVSDVNNRKPVLLLSTTITEERIIDGRKGEVLAQHVMVGSGYGNPMVGGDDWRVLKSWLRIGGCHPMRGDFERFRTAVQRLGRKK